MTSDMVWTWGLVELTDCSPVRQIRSRVGVDLRYAMFTRYSTPATQTNLRKRPKFFFLKH